MGIEEKDTLSILIDGEHIVLKKHSPSCFICGEEYGYAIGRNLNKYYRFSKEIIKTYEAKIA